ncbi:MAG: AmmeMemoRadiSam system protein A [Burkholderiales bacterium]
MFIDRGTVLLALARSAIARALGLPYTRTSRAPWLLKPGASFVTLMREGELRGCVGTVLARRSLLSDVRRNAVAASTRDPRFTPLTRDEYEMISIEVSLLSALEAILCRDESDALARLRPKIDGVFLEHEGKRATFLPQVWEALPEPVEFLAQLKAKAFLPPGFWSNDLRLWRYTVRKWKESEFKAAA